MTSAKQSFKAIPLKPLNAVAPDLSVLDVAGKVAEAADIGDIVRPSDRAGKGAQVVDLPKSAKARHPKSAPVGMRRLTIDVPEYVAKNLHARANDTNTTVRYIILEALRKSSFDIKPEHMIADGRRAV